MNLTFHKSERLRLKALVDPLFREGRNIYDFPLRLTYRPISRTTLRDTFKIAVPDGIAPLQVMVTIPKKRRRKAVDRVRMRRLVREAWRLNRLPLRALVEQHPEIRTLSVSLIYLDDKNCDFQTISSKVRKLIAKLTSKLQA